MSESFQGNQSAPPEQPNPVEEATATAQQPSIPAPPIPAPPAPPAPPSSSVLSETTTPEPASIPAIAPAIAPATASAIRLSSSKPITDSDPEETIAVHQYAAPQIPQQPGPSSSSTNVTSNPDPTSNPTTATTTTTTDQVSPDVVTGAERSTDPSQPSEQSPPQSAPNPQTPSSTRGAKTSARGAAHPTANGTPTSSQPSTQGRGGGRGRGKPGRPRGRGRGGGAAGRSSGGRKRKRGIDGDGARDDEDDGDSDGASTSSEEFNAVSMTKSGRAVQRPTSFVPPSFAAAAAGASPGGIGQAQGQGLASPSTAAGITGGTAAAASGVATTPRSAGPPQKKKRMYRRNPEAAVCKVCLRGTSPSKNMIVFCDGCNQAFHRYCHVPVIDQLVVDELDKEWFCSPCEKERLELVSEQAVADFVSARDATIVQKQKYFSSLPPGMLVTLLVRATTQNPDLPIFPPDFASEVAKPPTPSDPAIPPTTTASTNGQPSNPAQSSSSSTANGVANHSTSSTPKKLSTNPMSSLAKAVVQDEHVPDEHPPTYPRPGHGLLRTLPSEHENSKNIVDDGDRFGVFTHLYQVDEDTAMAGAAVNGN